MGCQDFGTSLWRDLNRKKPLLFLWENLKRAGAFKKTCIREHAKTVQIQGGNVIEYTVSISIPYEESGSKPSRIQERVTRRSLLFTFSCAVSAACTFYGNL